MKIVIALLCAIAAGILLFEHDLHGALLSLILGQIVILRDELK